MGRRRGKILIQTNLKSLQNAKKEKNTNTQLYE